MATFLHHRLYEFSGTTTKINVNNKKSSLNWRPAWDNIELHV